MHNFAGPSERDIVDIALSAARASPRWRELLRDWLDQGELTYARLPLTDKQALFGGRRSPRELLATRELATLERLYFSSGCSGGPRSWSALTEAGLVRESRRLSAALVDVWGVSPSQSILVINALPPGAALTLPGVLVVTTGPNSGAFVETLAGWAHLFETVFVVAEPWFAKAGLEAALHDGVPLVDVDLRVAVGGELLPEALRTYLAKLIDADLDRASARILSSLGFSEVGLQVCWETPATVALRRALLRVPARVEDLCGHALDTPPCIMTYDPRATCFEFIDSEMVLTCLEPARPLPLIRYCVRDRGGFVDPERARAFLSELDPRSAGSLPEQLVWISGRSGEPWSAAIGEALAACDEYLPMLTGGYQLDPSRASLAVQLAHDVLPPDRGAPLVRRLRAEMLERVGQAVDVELIERRRYPHPSSPWTTKFRRRAS